MDMYIYIDILIYLYLSIYKTGVRFIGHQAERQQKTYMPLMLDFVMLYK